MLKVKRIGLIKELKPLLIELTIKGIWISDKLIQKVLSMVGED